MARRRPNVIVMAGPNGAGKSTAAPRILRGLLAVDEFVNADVIAQGLSAYAPESVAMSAGRIMLTRLRELAADNASFAFETTLASRSFAPWIGGLAENRQYRFHLIFFWLSSPELAIARVANRVANGGHFVPDDTVRRRYKSGARNFFSLYRPLASTWRVYNNSVHGQMKLIAAGRRLQITKMNDPKDWTAFQKVANEATVQT